MVNPIFSDSPLPVTHLSELTHTACKYMPQKYTDIDADECISNYVSRDHMRPITTPTAAAAAARCIPSYIPEFPSDIPAECGGNLQCGDFTGREAVSCRVNK